MRKIPTTIVTQHPDNASKPYWLDKETIPTITEIEECFRSFSELGASEYKWDWEGKLVDESVTGRLFSLYSDYFHKNQIGKDIFLTFRIPNPRAEVEYRLERALMAVNTAASLGRLFGYKSHPLFEVILPRTEIAEEIIDIQEAFIEISNYKHKLLKESENLNHLEVIPIVEEAHKIANIDKLITEYLTLHKAKFGFTPEYLRPYIARSDPALNAGMVPTLISIKIALSKLANLESKTGVKMFPMTGAGSLPFRGGLTPDSVESFVNEYKGIRTTTIQSAFRYDYEIDKVKKAIEYLNLMLPKGNAQKISSRDEKKLLQLLIIFEKYYKNTIEDIAEFVNSISNSIPRRRERILHTGLFGYSRGFGKVKLPRAIKFTGSMYSIGIPPELIGTGRGIKWAKENGLLKLLENTYVNLRLDLQKALKYFNKDNLSILIMKDRNWQKIAEDVKFIEEYLTEDVEDVEKDQEHLKLTSTILKKFLDGKSINKEVNRAAVIRKSIG